MPALPQAALSVLLDRCLPVLAADSSPETIAAKSHPHCTLSVRLGMAITSPCLASELAACVQQPCSAAHIQQALCALTALPLHRSAAAAKPGCFGEQHVGTALLLAYLCAPGGRICLPDSPAPAVAWRFVEAMPRIAGMLAALAGDSSIAAGRLEDICFMLQVAAAALLMRLPNFRSDSQLAAWATACDAVICLAPTLLQLHERRQPQEPGRQKALRLSHSLVLLLTQASAAANHIGKKHAATGDTPAADKQLVRQLWALHTSMCRLVAWLAANPSGGRAAVLPAELFSC